MPQVVGAAIVGALGVSAPVWVATAIGNLTISVASTVLQRALASQPDVPVYGIKTSVTTSGENAPQSLILGTYATAGNMVAPPMTKGKVGSHPNGYLTYVMDVGDTPAADLVSVWIADAKLPLGPPEPAGSLYPGHRPVTDGTYAGVAWFQFFDGTQTTAAPGLIPHDTGDRPWRSDMIGRGIPYVIARFKFDDEVYSGFPNCLFEVKGTKLYDPRKDTSAGGAGTQRWDAPATWGYTENPAVMIYNILRGITLADGTVWGGEAEAADLPLSNWFAAMNECDVVVDGSPQYRAAREVKIGPREINGEEPAAVIEDLLRVCSGQIAEFGGTWRMRVGPPGMPVAVFTDEDIIITDDQVYDPFPGLSDTYNAVHAQYPEPKEKWASKEAPPRYDAAYEASDGNRRLVASLSLSACPYADQVQRLMLAYLKDGRRMRRNALSLPPDFAAVEVLDAVAFTSDRNGYQGKVFEVGSKTDRTLSLEQRVSLRERDPADYDWKSVDALPTTINPPSGLPIAAQAVPGWAVSATVINDAAGNARRPALVLTWDGDQPGVRGINWQVRVQGRAELAAQGSTMDVAAGGLIVTEGVLPGAVMEARGRLIARGRRTLWTTWTPANVPDVRLGLEDLKAEIGQSLTDLEAWADGTPQMLEDLQAEMDAHIAALDGRVTNETAALSGEVADVRQLALDQLIAAKDYTDNSVSTETLARQTDVGSLVARLNDLTAANISSTLITNGDFADGTTGWTGITVANGKATVGAAGAQQEFAATFGVGEVLQWRLDYNGPAAAVRVTFLDAGGAALGAEAVTNIAASSTVKTASGQHAPPEGAAKVRFRVTGNGLVIDNAAATRLDQQVLARIQSLETGLASDKQALASYKTTTNATLGQNAAAITAEGTARANADNALSTRVDTVESTAANQNARITTTETTLSGQVDALAQVKTQIEAESGRRDLVRDGTFARGVDYWPGGALPASGRIVARDAASADARVNTVPAERYYHLLTSDPANSWRETDYMPVTPGEVIEVSFNYARQATSVLPAVQVVFYGANKAPLTTYQLRGEGSGNWQLASGSTKAPAGSVYAKERYGVSATGTSTAGVTNISGLRTGAGYASTASFEALGQSFANDVQALADYKIAVAASFSDVQRDLTANATAISKVYTKAEAEAAISAKVDNLAASVTSRLGDKANASTVTALSNRVTDTEQGLSAQADSITSVKAQTNRGTANGQLRATAESKPSGVTAKIGLRAEATAGDSTKTAAMYLQARANNVSEVIFLADRFAFATDAAGNNTRYPFIIDGDNIYMDANVWIKEGSVGPDKIPLGGVHGIYSTTINYSGVRPNGTVGSLNVTPYSTSSRFLVSVSGTLTVPGAGGVDTVDTGPVVRIVARVNGSDRTLFGSRSDVVGINASGDRNYGATTEYPAPIISSGVASGANSIQVRLLSNELVNGGQDVTFAGALNVWEAKR